LIDNLLSYYNSGWFTLKWIGRAGVYMADIWSVTQMRASGG